MTRQASCPESWLLAEFARQGKTPPDVEAHVSTCDFCRAELAREGARAGSGPRARHPRTTVSMAEVETRAAPLELERGLNLGRYVLLDKLGEGGMGVVYAAYDSTLDRKVALKFLLASQGKKRLLREAQVMARLSHPNIVALFDAATFQDRVFVSMEYIDGVDLGAWLAQAPRAWDEVLALMLRAADGLVALHSAGLVHRDFKPENVLVGKDGTVKVTDFGLTRPAEAMADDDAEPEGAPESLVHQRLTRRGRLVGTPEYVAPELVHGKAADALSDQFAFSVALFEALYGVSPFVEPADGRWRSQRWALRAVPEKSRVPARVSRAIVRGLSVVPEDRFPSMQALRDVLREDPGVRRRRRLWTAGAALTVAASLAGAGYVAVERENKLCQGAERKLAGVWDAPRRGAVLAALRAIPVPYASVTAERVAQALDAYTVRWVQLHTEACEATRKRGEHSEDVLERRMICLDRRRNELDALTDELARADAQVVERAIGATHELHDPSSCLDLEANRFAYDAPKDAATRTRSAALRTRIDRARAIDALGKPKEALPVAARARADADQLGYAPVQAEALAVLGQVQSHMADKAAEGTLLEAVRTAEAARHDEVAAMAWTWAVRAAWDVSGNHEQAHEWARFAEAALHRLGNNPALEARFHNHLGSLLWREGKYEEALARYARARELVVREFGEEHEETARIDNNTGLTYTSLGNPDRAVETYRRALHTFEKRLGPEHPHVATGYHNLGMGLIEQRKMSEAIEALTRAHALQQKLLGPEHPTNGGTLNHLGVAYRELGDTDRALAYHRKALSIREKALGHEHVHVGLTLLFEGETLNAAHRYDEAMTSLRESLRILEKVLGSEHSDVADVLTRLGEAELGKSRPGAAIPYLERALAIRQNRKGDAAYFAANEFLLAQALGLQSAQAARARELAGSAIAHFKSVGPYRAREVAEVERWLASSQEAQL